MKTQITTTLLMLLLTFSLLAQQKRNLLEIRFPKETNGYVLLTKRAEAGSPQKFITLDSARITNNKYTYHYDHVKEPFMVFMTVHEKDSVPKNIFIVNNYIRRTVNCVWLDNEQATIEIDPQFVLKKQFYAKIKGSITNDIQQQLNADMVEKHKFTSIEHGHIIDFNIIKQNPQNLFLLQHLNQSKYAYLSLDSLETALQLFDNSIKNHSLWIGLENYIKNSKQIEKSGIKYIYDFSDTTGKRFFFKDFIQDKKFGLIVFWASWCGPCKAELPHLKKMYEKYSNHVAFTSLSVDKNKTDWQNAVKNSAWPNLAGFHKSQTYVADCFNISYVPAYLIVDQKGKVIYNFVRTPTKIEEIDKILSELCTK